MIKDHIAVKAHSLPCIYALPLSLYQPVHAAFVLSIMKKNTHAKKRGPAKGNVVSDFPAEVQVLKESEGEGKKKKKQAPECLFALTGYKCRVQPGLYPSYRLVTLRLLYSKLHLWVLTLNQNQVNLSKGGGGDQTPACPRSYAQPPACKEICQEWAIKRSLTRCLNTECDRPGKLYCFIARSLYMIIKAETINSKVRTIRL